MSSARSSEEETAKILQNTYPWSTPSSNFKGPVDRIQNEKAEADLIDRKGVNVAEGRL